MTTDSTTRFSDRVHDYVSYRPGYPRAVVTFLHENAGIDPRATVADVGSGTGIFTRLLVEAGHTVYAIEPNAPMRAAAERDLAGMPRFISVAATAEHTSLDDRSVDVVTAAQAFHWFDVARVRREFRRILRAGGHVVLVWNDRRESVTEFDREYQALIDRYNADLAAVDHRRLTRDDTVISSFFGSSGCERFTFDNSQVLLGAWTPAGEDGQPARRLTAGTLGGVLEGDARRLLSDDGDFLVQASLVNGDLKRIAQETTGERRALSGKVIGQIRLGGTSHGAHTWRGEGLIRLRDADIYQLPVMVSLLPR